MLDPAKLFACLAGGQGAATGAAAHWKKQVSSDHWELADAVAFKEAVKPLLTSFSAIQGRQLMLDEEQKAHDVNRIVSDSVLISNGNEVDEDGHNEGARPDQEDQ